MQITNYIQDSIVDGKGLRFTLFTQGCPHKCVGCHNPDTHDFSGGIDISTDEILKEIFKNPLTDGVTFSGGEPFCQAEDCITIAKAVREKGLNIWAYSGFTFEELSNSNSDQQRELLSLCDVLVDGKFEIEKKDLCLKWKGSSNQKVIDVKKSLETNEIIEL